MRVRSHRYDRYSGWQPSLPEATRDADLVVCFGASTYLDFSGPFAELSEAFPRAIITGCSTAGEIHGLEVDDETLSVAAVEFETTEVRSATVPISVEGSRAAGEALAKELLEAEGLRAVFLLSDGLQVNGTELARGINFASPADVIVTGGLAADGDRFQSTWVLVDGKPTQGFASAVGLYGDRITVGHGSKGGWDIFGPERIVTRSEGNVLYELDGKPALGLYKEYLGDLAEGLPATGLLFPLALRSPNEEKQLVRTILGTNEEAESLTFAGDMPEGHRAQLMQANFDRLVDGAEGAADFALQRGSEAAQLSIAISCVGRRLVLGERTEDELEATMHVLPEGITQIGFYSYGEMSPYAEGSCDLHNQTMTLTTIAER